MVDDAHDLPAARPYRAALLRALDAHAPGVLRSLKDLLPAYDIEAGRTFHRSRCLRNYPEDFKGADRDQAERERGRWLTELERWASRWHLREPWVLYAAEEQLELRRVLLLAGQADPPLTWQPQGMEPPLGCAWVWHPCHETWAEFVAGVVGRLERYREDRLVQLAGEGVAAPRPIPPRAFAWTVRYQVLGQPIAAVARADRVSRNSVRAAVHDVAHLVGLQLRQPSRGGAPAKAGTPGRQLRLRLAA
jgi:hypothetical protein